MYFICTRVWQIDSHTKDLNAKKKQEKYEKEEDNGDNDNDNVKHNIISHEAQLSNYVKRFHIFICVSTAILDKMTLNQSHLKRSLCYLMRIGQNPFDVSF